MQCYASKSMRLGLYRAITVVNPNIAYDDMLLNDLLDELAIESPQQLFAELDSPQLQSRLNQLIGDDIAIAA